MSRHPAAACPVPDVGVGISNVKRSVTGCVPASGSGLSGPGVGLNLGIFGLATLRGLSRRVCPGSRVSASPRRLCSRDWYILQHLVRPWVRCTRQAKLPSRFPRFRHQLGQPQSPPYYPPRQTAPGSSSGFCEPLWPV